MEIESPTMKRILEEETDGKRELIVLSVEK